MFWQDTTKVTLILLKFIISHKLANKTSLEKPRNQNLAIYLASLSCWISVSVITLKYLANTISLVISLTFISLKEGFKTSLVLVISQNSLDFKKREKTTKNTVLKVFGSNLLCSFHLEHLIHHKNANFQVFEWFKLESGWKEHVKL